MKKIFSIIILSLFSLPSFSFAMESTPISELTDTESALRETYRTHQEQLETAISEIQKKSLRRAMGLLEKVQSEISYKSFTEENIVKLNADIEAGKLHLYAVSKSYTPVLYTHEFSSVFGGNSGGLLLDDYLQIDPLEFVGFPDTVFDISEIVFDGKNPILRVTSREYSYVPDTGHYIDPRFVRIYWQPIASPKERTILAPDKQEVISRLRSQVGKIYIWGGNANTGAPELFRYYNPKKKVDPIIYKKWVLDGFDCSGLLFWATNGGTPRNTSNLVTTGTGVAISGKTKEEIKSLLKPLDVIVWVGHNMIILDNNEVIESTVNFGSGVDKPNGVRIRTIDEVLDEVLSKRIAVDDWKDSVEEGKKKFVIRRWIQ